MLAGVRWYNQKKVLFILVFGFFLKMTYISACLYANGKDPVFMKKTGPVEKRKDNCMSEVLQYVRGDELQCGIGGIGLRCRNWTSVEIG